MKIYRKKRHTTVLFAHRRLKMFRSHCALLMVFLQIVFLSFMKKRRKSHEIYKMKEKEIHKHATNNHLIY